MALCVSCRYLLLHPKDHRVVVLEDLASPSIFRNTLASVLFKDFKVLHPLRWIVCDAFAFHAVVLVQCYR